MILKKQQGVLCTRTIYYLDCDDGMKIYGCVKFTELYTKTKSIKHPVKQSDTEQF